jgi:23S rRNA (guanosine2251-2'-O)-methyltransferase
MFDLIFGIHSIAAALQNPNRVPTLLVASEEGLSELAKKHRIQKQHIKCDIKIVSSHEVQDQAARWCKQLGVEYSRVPSQIMLQTEPLQTFTIQDLLHDQPKRILALDQISDVHNGAAILRTASFYGVDAVIIPQERSFGLTPSFYRIASGATEGVKLYRSSSLSRAVTALNDQGYMTIGLSEHAEKKLVSDDLKRQNLCLVLGAEETGLSNAVLRVVERTLSLESQGMIKSLNVSAAAAIAMEKCFSQLN